MTYDWQVETIGDAYMVVSGAPTVSTAHAQSIANMSLDMIASLNDFVAPAAGGNIHIRIGQSSHLSNFPTAATFLVGSLHICPLLF